MKHNKGVIKSTSKVKSFGKTGPYNTSGLLNLFLMHILILITLHKHI